VESIFYIKDCPIAGNFLERPEDDKLIPLNILICKDCGIAQLDKDCFVPKEDLFKKYFYKTHSITTLKNFFYDQAEELHNLSTKKMNVLEIGGNSCPLGERLTKYGHIFINVDPSDTALVSNPEKVRLVNDFFDVEVALKIKEEYGQMDIIYSANSFAHMEDLISVISGIQELLAEDGKLIIQVQDFEYLLEDLCFPFFYHEHLFYYTSYTLAHLMAKYGFKLNTCSKNNLHGRSINCVFEKTKMQVMVDPEITRLVEMIAVFTSKIDIVEYNMNKFLEDTLFNDKRIVAYGASGQANILFAKFGITKNSIPYIIDDAPLKLGKITPYSHIEIKNSEFIEVYKPDYIIVTAYNFINEIKKRTNKYDGKWVVPLPDLKEV
jgi:methylation protein EvaC